MGGAVDTAGFGGGSLILTFFGFSGDGNLTPFFSRNCFTAAALCRRISPRTCSPFGSMLLKRGE